MQPQISHRYLSKFMVDSVADASSVTMDQMKNCGEIEDEIFKTQNEKRKLEQELQ